MNDFSVNWFDSDFTLKLEQATDEGLYGIAAQILAEAIPNVPRDTGFLANSGYVNSPINEGFQRQQSRRSPRGSKSKRLYETVDQPPQTEETVVGFAANYAIYVESRTPFLYPAMLRVQGQVGGIIEAAGRKHFG